MVKVKIQKYFKKNLVRIKFYYNKNGSIQMVAEYPHIGELEPCRINLRTFTTKPSLLKFGLSEMDEVRKEDVLTLIEHIFKTHLMLLKGNYKNYESDSYITYRNLIQMVFELFPHMFDIKPNIILKEMINILENNNLKFNDNVSKEFLLFANKSYTNYEKEMN